MKPVFNIENVTLNIHTYQRAPALVALGAALAAATATPAPEPVELTGVPAHGEYWPGEGGKNGGYVPARCDVPAHYLIIAAEDVGKRAWGGYGVESKALSKTDGKANTCALIESETDHPAAQAAAEYTADGHNDFCLPSAAELYQAWVNCPELFAKEWYWSSTQRSAYNAFIQGFGDGYQYGNGKTSEFLVRPVRRKFI
ncbi:hypothetical protein PSCICO_47810 [Pseudomonas cichorii]|uniref:DUF1566 domain-containing protein n=1 Tax=Pseudomonas cichorii TaxID=36746 RepID=UPI00191082BB|nr:DUF1566 domain-containing protein [Pseudomonas cichorii]GFM89382.1 hypothetical protein PSCICO_47810 [Pseudomonas cichorii]